MKKNVLVLLFVLLTTLTNASIAEWGKTGHRTIGAIAEKHLSKKAKKHIYRLLNGSTLAFVSIHSDEIRSDHQYDHFKPWHYVNFPADSKYGEHPTNEAGDVVQGIKNCILKIRNEEVSIKEKAFYLKLLTHLVGDLHQPLHVGNGEDRGGNDIKIQWFWEDSNLHRVWDSDMIDSYKMSYSELANNTNYKTKKEIQTLKQGKLIDWVTETKKLANQTYNSAKKGDNLKYEYMYHQFPIVRQQLDLGGIRLAAILNEIFKKKSDWIDHFLSNTPDNK